MFGLGHWELIIILVIVLIIFGAGKLPEIGGGLGKAIGSFKKGIKGSGSGEEDEAEKIQTK
jgi:sec-independent protein translocase protein TatA